MANDTSPRGGHGGAPVNHDGQRRQCTRVIRVGRSRRVITVRALARNGRNRTNARGNTMAHAQAMAGAVNVQRVAIPPAGPVNPPARPVNPPAGPVNQPAGPLNPPAIVQAGNGAIANAGAPPAPAPAFQGFAIDAVFLDPPLRKSQVGPIFHSVAQPLPW